ncbi:hypothetical protein E2562_002531 [Oryza meyeriana var. granulata]|uniref:Uncharacterized protein n=1 Tax=Oryza meyeriana var. granulata TaxID=110450 RepID=A0A6G1F2R0_9ORYZ|nr:hypothetical protein E2562_002531 [Oryza meyeriana var. granulata]KAF0931180.1 hypothetical protein E2562_002531 [Oryza meyeriana var. granulata]
MSRDGGAGGGEVDLWAMAAELERKFAGYKQRLAERSGTPRGGDGVDDAGGGGNRGGEEEDEGDGDGGDGGDDVRGRMYEAYTRRRDERLREGWRARMERKEAEVKALWAQLERGAGGRAAGCCATATDDGGGTAGEKHGDDGEKRRSSDVAAPAGRISGKKHARTRSFSSSTAKSSRPDAGTRRALSQEPPPPTSEPPAAAADGGGAGRKENHRVARVTGAGAMAAAKRRVFSGHRSSAAKEHGSAKGGPKSKPPRSLPRRSSSGGLEDLKEAAQTTTCAVAAPVQSCSTEEASLPTQFAGEANAPAASPASDCGEVVSSGADDRHEAGAEAKTAGEHNAEEVTVSPGKLANGEITSDSDTEPSYVYVKKDDVEEDDAMTRRSEALAGSDDKPDLEMDKKNSAAAAAAAAAEETTAPPSDAVAAESATTIAKEAPARESSDESSFSGRSGGSPPPSSTSASCISRAPSIERLLEEDAALLRKKRQESAEKCALTTTRTMTTPPARVSGAARSPREAVRGFKRFLSFGKKNRGGREVTVIDCTSPSVPSVADDDSGSGGWQSSDTIKPRMTSLDAASDDMDHGYTGSPRAGSLQSLVAASPAKSELNEIDPQEKSPKGEKCSL